MDQNITYEKLTGIIDNLYEATGAIHYFDKPLIGIASATDPLFHRFKSIIGTFHWTPDEALKLEYPESTARSVIAWILPIGEKARAGNRRMTDGPSREWARVRSFGELCNEQLRLQVAGMLRHYGYPSVVPQLLQRKTGYKFRDLGYASHWSERHAAFVAGLGTFGLSSGLITEKGVAMRVGTVVTSLELPAGKRPYGDDPYAWCNSCGACSDRCPAKAIGKSPDERNKKACCDFIFEETVKNRAEKFGWLEYELGCGLCQAGVPCECRRP